MARLYSIFLLTVMAAAAADSAGRVKYMGGTMASFTRGTKGEIQMARPEAITLVLRASTVVIPYDKLNLIEYGQEVNRRILLAWLISPLFLLSKSRAHYVTLGFTDAEGHQQACVLRLDKKIVRGTLASLEARSGRTIKFLDDEARRRYSGGR